MKAIDTDNHIEAPEDDYLYKSTSLIPQAGYGLFTAIDIYKNETIPIFRGEILSNREAKKRADAGCAQYFISMLDGSIMDSNNTDCYAKYANDAKGAPSLKLKNNANKSLENKI